ncbi:MAG: RNA polymerase sigma factor [Deltaproteobacteria bacterium]|nr:RNA polymerase sigma factor [Deltaproteobacteria bacterium]
MAWASATLTAPGAACDDADGLVRDGRFVSALREHEAALGALARRLCGNQADADDLLQETYERALRAWDRYADRGNLRSWLATIMNNRFIDRCRRARRIPMAESLDERELAAPEPIAPPVWANVTAEQVADALGRIGDEFRAVYELHAAGRSYEEIADALGIPKNTVGTRLIRARRKLKDVLAQRVKPNP